MNLWAQISHAEHFIYLFFIYGFMIFLFLSSEEIKKGETG